MKAISIRQPFAHLVIEGVKKYEIRTWMTKYRGPLLIVSSAKRETDIRDEFTILPAWLTDEMIESLPLGCALGVVELVDCIGTEDLPRTAKSRAAACCRFAKYEYAHVYKNPRRIKQFPVKGWLNLYEVDHAIRYA